MVDQESAYRRVLDDLRDQILSGIYPAGAKLPSIRKLGDQYEVPRSSVERALKTLASEGHVLSRPGSGYFVRSFARIPRSSPRRLSNSRRGHSIQHSDIGNRPHEVRDVVVDHAPAPTWVTQPLGVAVDEPVVSRSRRYVVDGRPVQMATSYLPAELALGTPIMLTDPGDNGIYGRLAEAGHAPARFTEYVQVRMPLPIEIDRLELPAGTPVAEITRHAFEASGRCVEVSRMILDGTAYVLDYSFVAEAPRKKTG